MNIKDVKYLIFEEIDPHLRLAGKYDLSTMSIGITKSAFEYRITYILNGSGKIEIDGISYNCSKGDLLFWHPSIKYCFRNGTKDFIIINLCFYFTSENKFFEYLEPTSIEKFDSSFIHEKVFFKDLEIFNNTIYLKQYPDSKDRILNILQEFKMQKNYYKKITNGLLLSLLGEILRFKDAGFNQVKMRMDIVEDIIIYIHSNYHSTLSVNSIAKKYNYHPNYINRLFVAVTGCTLYQYIIKVRLLKAYELITSTNFTLDEIANKVGIKELDHFSKIFKQKMSYAPSKLRTNKLT